MSHTATLKVDSYVVRDDWTNQTLFRTRDFEKALEALEEWRKTVKDNEITLYAEVDA